MKIKQTIRKVFRSFVLLFCLIFCLLTISSSIVFMSSTTTHASGACLDNGGNDDCVRKNCDQLAGAYFNGDANKCLQAVSKCENTNLIWYYMPVSQSVGKGSCSNALVSCYTQEKDTKACGDNNVISYITQCNAGNVGASNTTAANLPGNNNIGNNCGVDDAIEVNNKQFSNDGVYASNQGLNTKWLNDHAAEACKLPNTQQAQDCNKEMGQQSQECLKELGGINGNYTDAQMSDCLAKKASRPTQCTSLGGSYKWDDATKKCTLPPPPPDPCANHGGTDPNNSNKCADGTTVGEADGAHGDVNTKTGYCGEARVNLLACGKEGGATAISNVLRIIIIVLTILVGVAALGGLAWASVTYARATDNASTVSEARTMIRNIVIGLLLYGFLVAIVNWLVPGSVIGG